METNKEDIKYDDFNKSSFNRSNNDGCGDDEGDFEMLDINASIQNCIKSISDDYCKNTNFVDSNKNLEDSMEMNKDFLPSDKDIEDVVVNELKNDMKINNDSQIIKKENDNIKCETDNNNIKLLSTTIPMISPPISQLPGQQILPIALSSSLSLSSSSSPSSVSLSSTTSFTSSALLLSAPPSISPPSIPTPPASISPSSAQSATVITTTPPPPQPTLDNVITNVIEKPIANCTLNGIVIPPTSGKPKNYMINEKKINKGRGRPKQRKALVAMYQSQISDNQIGIRLKLKKSEELQQKPGRSRKQTARLTTTAASTATTGAIRKPARRPRTQKKRVLSDNDDSGYEKPRRKKKVTSTKVVDPNEPTEQSDWGSKLPEPILCKIFEMVIQQEGCLPTLIRLGKVCSLWHNVSLTSTLWHTMDLATWTKERFRNELKLKWLIEFRLKNCQDINLSHWKVMNISCVLQCLYEGCPNLVGITLTGWKGLTNEQLMFVVTNFKKLQRIDLSSINMELKINKTAVGVQSLCDAIQVLNKRLTHLTLAHNRLAGIPKMVSELAAHCPNLILLDLSNIQTIAVSHGILNIEKLQSGCQKLKILRITNSHITLNTATLEEQEESPGFPDLEELSIASVADESRLIINNDFFLRILKNSTKLKLLDVRGCTRLTHDSLIRLRAWDIKYLFLSGCLITRDTGSGLELVASKWAHSLTELDLAWANVEKSLDDALKAIAEKGPESSLNHLNLCGSSVSLAAVKDILIHCPLLNSINLASCRSLPRGCKRLLQGATELKELRENLGVTLKVPIVKPNDE